MRASRLASFLQIRPGEARLVALIAMLFALIDASRGFGPNAVNALFFKRFGVEFLPYMYMGLGVVNFLVTLAYTAGLSRFNRRRFFVGLLAVLIGMLLLERAAILLGSPILWPVLWLSINMLSSVLGTFMWHLAGDVVDTRQAKRLFALFTSASIAGSVIGNLITGPLANFFGTDNLLLVYAGVLVVCLVLTRYITQQFFIPSDGQRGTTPGFVENVRAGLNYVRGSSLLKLMAFSSVLFSILYFSISFLFSQAVADNIPDEAAIAGFLGVFNGITTGVTLLVSLFLANRLYARIGLVNAVFTLPLTYVGSFILMFVSFTLPSAITVRFSQRVLLSGLANTAWNTFYNVVPSDKRGPVRTFDFGVPAQVGTILSGVLLVLGQTILQREQVFIVGFVMATACSFLVWRMRASYGEALVDALRAGRVEVFDLDERAFSGYQGDRAAIKVAQNALTDAKPGTRRLGLEILALMGAKSAVPQIINALDDLDAEVRIAAANALIALDLRESAPALVSLLYDEPVDPALAAVVVRALPHAFDTPPPRLLDKLAELQSSRNSPPLRAWAAAAASAFGGESTATRTFDALLADDDPNVRVLGLDALGDALARIPTQNGTLALRALDDPVPMVRRAAAQTLRNSNDGGVISRLAGALADPNASVRSAASSALRAIGPAASEPVLAILRDGDLTAQSAALDALNPEEESLVESLHEYVRNEISRLKQWRIVETVLEAEGEDRTAIGLICESLQTRCAAGEQRLVKALGLLDDPDRMAFVGEGLQARDSETRAAAVEALETLGDKELAREITPLLEDTLAPDEDKPLTIEVALRHMLDEGGWIRAIAARAAADLNVKALVPDLRAIEAEASGIDRMAHEAARDALGRLGETVQMETLQTVSSLERVLLLREVPLFVDLTPEDLKQIADIAREELYHDGMEIAREGDHGEEMYVIVEGTVHIVKGEDSIEKELATRGAGDFVGEMAIIESEPRFATIRAEGEVRVLVIEARAFDAILRDRPEVSRALVRGLSRRLRELT